MQKILIIDNYDSFTYNLVHYFESLNCEVIVYQNDEFELDEINEYQNIVLSPGPGIPYEAGLLLDVIKKYGSSKNILGICLGQQAINEAFGGTLTNLDEPFHGVETQITVIDENEVLFKNLPKQFNVGRYHSWVINANDLPNCLEITAIDQNQNAMAIRHKTYKIYAVQFHPESILTQFGKEIIHNWIATL